MSFNLINHQYKAAMRSPMFGKSLGIKLFMGFLFLIISLELLGFSFYAGTHLAKEGGEPLNELLSYFIYFFLVMLVLRSLLQKLPTMTAIPYLLLPIKKSRLIHFILKKAFFNALNLISLFIIVPMFFALSSYFTMSQILLVLASIIICDLFINYLAIYIKRIQIKYEIVFYIFLLLILLLVCIDHFKLIDIKSYSLSIFQSMIEQPILLLIPVFMFLGIYTLNYQLLYRNFTLDEFSKGSRIAKGSLNKITYLERFGRLGEFMFLEIRMLIRGKRSRTQLMMLPLILLYAYIYYSNPNFVDSTVFLIFVGLFLTGFVMITIGLYFFSWESGHFDLILTSNTDYYSYIKSKYSLMVASSVFMYILALPYIYFGVHIFIINTVALIFNLGFTTFVLLYFACNNKKYMNLSQGAAFNFQGVSAQHYILIIPILAAPTIIYAPFGIMGYSTLGLACVGTIGLLGIIFHEKLLIAVTKRFINKKYKMAEGFRIKS